MLESNVQETAVRGVSRRDFLKFCSMMAGVLALPRAYSGFIEKALADEKKRLPVIWLELQDCAGCTEALLRATQPTVSQLVLDVLSVDYHETIMAASGNLAEEAKQATIKAGGYLLVVEGSIPKGESEFYCTVGGKSAVQLLNEAVAGAAAVVAVGNCAAFGGWPSASPNPTNATFVSDLVKGKPVMNIPGCPYNPVNLTAAVVHFLTFNELPAMDEQGRPLFAYGALIHDNCPRRGHFDAGQFVVAWGDEGHQKGWCLYKMGCKGPVTFHNCPAVGFNDGTSWPIKAGHGCIGCSEKGFWDLGVYNQANLHQYAPPTTYAPVQLPTQNLSPATSGLIGAAAGIAVGAASVAAYQALSKPDEDAKASDKKAKK